MPEGSLALKQRRSLPELARPKGNQKVADLRVTTSLAQRKAMPPRRAFKSSHFLVSKINVSSVSHPQHQKHPPPNTIISFFSIFLLSTILQ